MTTKTSNDKQQLSRRNFIGYASAVTAIAALAACSKDDNDMPSSSSGIDLGSGDTGILNYAYALEQLEAAFYKQVTDTPFSGITAAETALLTDIRDHEIAHREFFKKALGSSAIPGLEVNFSGIQFNDRTSVLNTAKAFEDLGRDIGWKTFIPRMEYCTDNAAMIALTGYYKFLGGEFSPLSIPVSARAGW